MAFIGEDATRASSILHFLLQDADLIETPHGYVLAAPVPAWFLDDLCAAAGVAEDMEDNGDAERDDCDDEDGDPDEDNGDAENSVTWAASISACLSPLSARADALAADEQRCRAAGRFRRVRVNELRRIRRFVR